MAHLLPLSLQSTKPPPNPNPRFKSLVVCNLSKRAFALSTTAISIVSLTIALRFSPNAVATAETPTAKSILAGIANTKSWVQFFGGGFAIRVPPQFEDIMEPEDYSAGMSLYGDKAKPKTFAARFASSDGSEVVSVVVRPSNQLKITFLEVSKSLGTLCLYSESNLVTYT
ncbi:hypothetical protein GIB67_006841 [Kingdonia uniflora]|uniref:Photosystem II reaction center PsbP family protein n=1 Tax=Kingdonia uniflora TaxID=39325 RepID=A0A7J7L022_9MAGN|nr:hypothetical protein GIB67_006841 [Kingdonia uniflora]